MTGGARRLKSRHPKLLWSAAVALLLVWVALFWVHIEITNYHRYSARLVNGEARLWFHVRDGLLGAMPWRFDNSEILVEKHLGQVVRIGWIRGKQSLAVTYHWSEGLGTWPAIALTDNQALGARWDIRLPLWFPLLIVALLIWRWYRRHRPRAGTCRNCGYDLTGNVSGRCPECGTWISEAGAAERATER